MTSFFYRYASLFGVQDRPISYPALDPALFLGNQAKPIYSSLGKMPSLQLHTPQRLPPMPKQASPSLLARKDYYVQEQRSQLVGLQNNYKKLEQDLSAFDKLFKKEQVLMLSPKRLQSSHKKSATLQPLRKKLNSFSQVQSPFDKLQVRNTANLLPPPPSLRMPIRKTQQSLQKLQTPFKQVEKIQKLQTLQSKYAPRGEQKMEFKQPEYKQELHLKMRARPPKNQNPPISQLMRLDQKSPKVVRRQKKNVQSDMDEMRMRERRLQALSHRRRMGGVAPVTTQFSVKAALERRVEASKKADRKEKLRALLQSQMK